MERDFKSRDECVRYLRLTLSSSGANGNNDEAISRLADDFAGLCEVVNPNTFPGLQLTFGRWVVRDEDLKLFASFKDAMIALSPVGFILHELPLTTATSLTFALVSALRNLTRFSGEVDEGQARILIVMKREARPLTATEILDAVRPSLPQYWDGLYDVPSVEFALKKLQAVPTPNGPAKFVAQLEDGRWVLNGI